MKCWATAISVTKIALSSFSIQKISISQVCSCYYCFSPFLPKLTPRFLCNWLFKSVAAPSSPCGSLWRNSSAAAVSPCFLTTSLSCSLLIHALQQDFSIPTLDYFSVRKAVKQRSPVKDFAGSLWGSRRWLGLGWYLTLYDAPWSTNLDKHHNSLLNTTLFNSPQQPLPFSYQQIQKRMGEKV